jgi:hypothetical protein
MSNKELDDLLLTNEPLVETKLDLDKVKENLPKFSSEKICEMIVCDRYFGLEQKISSICMEELSKRRLAGDNFDFESYIEKVHGELPELDLSVSDIRTVLQKAINMRKFSR